MSTTLDEIRELLGQLGDTSDQIAETLNGRDITGRREDPHCCPIANLIAASVAGADKWPAEDFTVGDDCIHTPHGEMYTPDVIGDFIGQFDNGAYPELEDDPEVDE